MLLNFCINSLPKAYNYVFDHATYEAAEIRKDCLCRKVSYHNVQIMDTAFEFAAKETPSPKH